MGLAGFPLYDSHSTIVRQVVEYKKFWTGGFNYQYLLMNKHDEFYNC